MMASTEERLLGYVQRRIMTENGWRYYCTECNDYHHYEEFYKAASRPFGIMSHCSEKRRGRFIGKREKKDPNIEKVDTSYFKLNKVTEEDIKNTLDLLNSIGYDTTGNVHEQFIKKHENEIREAVSKRQKNPKKPFR